MVEIVDKAESLIAYEVSLTPQSTFDDVGAAIIGESRRRGYTRDESIACVSTGIQESGLRPSAVSPNGLWRGIYQQDASYPGRDDPKENIWAFLDRLDVKRHSLGASPDIWLNIFWLQQRPGEPSADAAYRNGRQAYLTEIKRHIARAAELYDRLSGGTPTADRPDYNEYPMWSASSSSRGRTVDLFLLHTQEGDGNADSLARFLQNPANEVSYHYTVSEDYNDHGVTVCDVVDTDEASWSALSANSRSINLCFAGSRAGWSRDQWLKQSRAIDVAAYLAVQDCKKYDIAIKVLAPPYTSDPPGISDHNYVTQWLKDGDHTDVGANFPWDVFAASVAKYCHQTPAPAPAPARQFPKDFTDRELLESIVAHLGPGDPTWQSKGMTLRDKVWSLDRDAS